MGIQLPARAGPGPQSRWQGWSRCSRESCRIGTTLAQDPASFGVLSSHPPGGRRLPVPVRAGPPAVILPARQAGIVVAAGLASLGLRGVDVDQGLNSTRSDDSAVDSVL